MDAARTRPSALGVAGAVLLVAAGLLVALQVVAAALAQALPGRAALSVDPRSASALTDAAETAYDAGQAQAARALARRALSLQPFDVVALRIVGLVDAAQSGPDGADSLMTLAGNWSLRDEPTQAWLLQQRLRHRAFASAFAHADALMRVDSDVWPTMFKVLDAVAQSDPQGFAPLVGRLATDPPWRVAYFESLSADPQHQATAAALAMALARSPHPVTKPELSALLNGLVSGRQYRLADAVWRRVSGAAARVPADGGFDQPQTPEPFGWSIPGGEGAMVGVQVDGDAAGERALHVAYDGYSSPELAKAFIVIGPGPHRLTGRMRDDGTAGADQLGWTVRCADDGRILASAPGPETMPAGVWRPFGVDFTVPASGCEGQWLQLTPYPGERQTTIGLWYADLAIGP